VVECGATASPRGFMAGGGSIGASERPQRGVEVFWDDATRIGVRFRVSEILGVSRQNKAPRRRRALVPDLRALPALHRHAVRAPGSPRVHRPSEMGKKAKGKHRLGTCGFPQSMRRADPKSPRWSTTAAAAPTVVLFDRPRVRVVRVWCLCVGPPITGTSSVPNTNAAVCACPGTPHTAPHCHPPLPFMD